MVKSTICLALFALSSNSHAYEFIKSFSLPSAVQFDDNITMSPVDSKSAFRFISTPRINFTAADELNDFGVDLALNIVRSNVSENFILDREDPRFDANWNRRFNRGDFNVNVGYLRTSTRVSEFEQTGLVFRDGNSVNRYVNTNLNYDINDRFSFSTELNFTKQKYADTTALTGFTNYETGMNLNYQYSDRMGLYTSIGYSKIKNDGVTSFVTQEEDDIKRLSIGVSYQYSPALSTDFSIGANRTDSGNSGWIATSRLDYDFSEYTKFGFSYDRGNYASGLGGFQESDNVNVSLLHQIGNQDTIGLSYFWGENRNLNTTKSSNFSTFYEHELSPSWSTSLSFSYRSISAGQGSSANGAQLGFTFIYNVLSF